MTRATRMGAVGGFSGGTRALLYYTSRRASDDLFSLDGQVAIVTGGAGRLGRQVAATLSSAGAAVALFDIVAPAANRRGLDADARLSSHVVDATDRAAVDRAIDEVVARFGAPTILVNNAGLDRPRRTPRSKPAASSDIQSRPGMR